MASDVLKTPTASLHTVNCWQSEHSKSWPATSIIFLQHLASRNLPSESERVLVGSRELLGLPFPLTPSGLARPGGPSLHHLGLPTVVSPAEHLHLPLRPPAAYHHSNPQNRALVPNRLRRDHAGCKAILVIHKNRPPCSPADCLDVQSLPEVLLNTKHMILCLHKEPRG